VATVYVPNEAKLDSVTIQGHSADLSNGRFSTHTLFQISTLPPQGAELDVVLGESAPQEWYVVDDSSGLPPGGEALVKARPATAVSFQDGDVTRVSRKVKI
jgi:hypothetical protein